jgi:hypothetical protein
VGHGWDDMESSLDVRLDGEQAMAVDIAIAEDVFVGNGVSFAFLFSFTRTDMVLGSSRVCH